MSRKEYLELGFAKASFIFPKTEIDLVNAEIQSLITNVGVADPINIRSECRRNTSGDYVVDRLDPILDIAPKTKELLSNNAYIESIEEITGGKASLFKCKMIHKQPSTTGYMPHQDGLYWTWMDADFNRLFSVVIALTDQEVNSGSIEVAPWRHASLLESKQHDPNGDISYDTIPGSEYQPIYLKSGESLAFHSLAPHRSTANLSSQNRTVLIASYIIDGELNVYSTYHREIRRRCKSILSSIGNESFEKLNDVLGVKLLKF